MATLDLRDARDKDGFVVYFGGRPNEVDTYTFANALVALSDAVRAVNAEVNPGYSVELRLEGLSEGSFQARVREKPITIASALKWASNVVVWPILVTWFYTHVLDPDETNITVNTDEVVIQRGHDRIVVPREAYDRAKGLSSSGTVSGNVAKALGVVKADPHVTSLGILKDFRKKHEPPALLIERSQFAVMIDALDADAGRSRTITQEATLGILKAVFAKGDRKWDFVWNGIKVGATITDTVFMTKVMSREIMIGAGDAIEATMEIEQSFDHAAGVWLNRSYRIARVPQLHSGSAGASAALTTSACVVAPRTAAE